MFLLFVFDGAERLRRGREANGESTPKPTWSEWWRSLFTFDYTLY